MSAADRAYRTLLLAYPAEFRAAYGREMSLAFRDCRREHHASDARFWCAILLDVIRSAPALRLDALRARLAPTTRTSGGTMKTMGILAIIVGLLETANASFEVFVGTGYPFAAGIIGVCGGALLFLTGSMLLRRGRSAATPALASAVACLAIFAIIGPVMKVMSIASTLLGVGFSLALLVFLFVSSRRPSAPSMA